MPFANPINNVEQLDIKEGEIIADLGAGVGNYTVPLGKKTGGSGRVYAVEVQKDLLNNIKKRAEDESVNNIDLLWGDIERHGSIKIIDHIVDVVVLANVLFQVEDRNGLVECVKRILKQDGRVLVVDWKDSFNNMGPEQGKIITQEEARIFFEKNDFVFDKNIETGSQHYGFILKRA